MVATIELDGWPTLGTCHVEELVAKSPSVNRLFRTKAIKGTTLIGLEQTRPCYPKGPGESKPAGKLPVIDVGNATAIGGGRNERVNK